MRSGLWVSHDFNSYIVSRKTLGGGVGLVVRYTGVFGVSIFAILFPRKPQLSQEHRDIEVFFMIIGNW